MFPVRRQCARAVCHWASLPRIHIFQIRKQLIVLRLGDGHPAPVVDMRGCGTLGERVITGVGEVMAVRTSPVAVGKRF